LHKLIGSARVSCKEIQGKNCKWGFPNKWPVEQKRSNKPWNFKMRSDLSKRSKAIGSATCIGNNVHVWLVCLLIYSNYKHRSISWGSWYDHFLRTTLQSNVTKSSICSAWILISERQTEQRLGEIKGNNS
jgi:hypothetical protein